MMTDRVAADALVASAANIGPWRTGGVVTAVIGIVSFPWKLYDDVRAYIFTWLVGYGVFVAFGLAAVSYFLLAQGAPRGDRTSHGGATLFTGSSLGP